MTASAVPCGSPRGVEGFLKVIHSSLPRACCCWAWGRTSSWAAIVATARDTRRAAGRAWSMRLRWISTEFRRGISVVMIAASWTMPARAGSRSSTSGSSPSSTLCGSMRRSTCAWHAGSGRRRYCVQLHGLWVCRLPPAWRSERSSLDLGSQRWRARLQRVGQTSGKTDTNPRVASMAHAGVVCLVSPGGDGCMPQSCAWMSSWSVTPFFTPCGRRVPHELASLRLCTVGFRIVSSFVYLLRNTTMIVCTDTSGAQGKWQDSFCSARAARRVRRGRESKGQGTYGKGSHVVHMASHKHTFTARDATGCTMCRLTPGQVADCARLPRMSRSCHRSLPAVESRGSRRCGRPPCTCRTP
eukprot:m.250860 g.250860  ORF g.250860 m.250860 type:complete len:356 (+) comp16912_c0_seq1:1171-2238(+)